MVPEIYRAIDIFFCHFGPFFVLLPQPDNRENQQFYKLKIVPGDIIILHMYTINVNHRMSGCFLRYGA